MKFRQTIQLGAALVLLVIVYFGQQMMDSQTEGLTQAEKKVFAFAPESLRKLSIQRLDEEATVAVRDEGGTWAITEPNPIIRPDAVLWNRVLEHLVALTSERTLPADALDMESYGLAIPRLTIRAEVAGTDHVLDFGYLEPTQTNHYAQLDGGPVFLVDKNEFFELDRPLSLLRQAFVVDNPEAPLLRLEYAMYMSIEEANKRGEPDRVGEESFVVVVDRESADAPWIQRSPIHVAAQQDRVNELANEIQFARGVQFIDDPEAFSDYGLDPATVRITVVDGIEGHPQTYYFGGTVTDGEAGGGLYARKEGEPSVFVMEPHITTLFPRNPNEFRERRLFVSQAKDIVRLERLSGDQGYVLEKDETGTWKMTQPPLDDTDLFYVSQFISAFKMLEAVRYYPGAPAEYGLETPEATFRLTLADTETPVEIRLVASTDVEGHYYVQTETGEVVSLPQEHIAFLLGSAQDFRDRALLRFEHQRAIQMDFSYEDTTFSMKKEHNRWLVTAPEGYHMPNQRDAENLLTTVTDLRAIAAERTDVATADEYGFDTPRFTFTVTLSPVEAGGATETLGPLTVGNVVPGIEQQRFARSTLREGVFRVKQEFVESIQASLDGIAKKAGPAGTGN